MNLSDDRLTKISVQVEQNFYVLTSTEFQLRECGGGTSSILVSDQGDYTPFNYINMYTTMFLEHFY